MTADDPAFWRLIIPDMMCDGDFVTINARDGDTTIKKCLGEMKLYG